MTVHPSRPDDGVVVAALEDHLAQFRALTHLDGPLMPRGLATAPLQAPDNPVGERQRGRPNGRRIAWR